MKKILLFASALAGLFLAGSCQRENLEPMESANTVTYTVTVPDALATKGIGDDVSNVNTLHYEVYRTAAAETVTFTDADRLLYHKTATVTNGTAKIELELVNDQNFTVLFWAQVGETNEAYDVDDLTAVTIKTPINANQVDYAAFSGVDFIQGTDALTDKTILLTRPVAQINLGTTEASLEAFDTYITVSKSSMTVVGLSNTFDVASQAASGTLTSTTEYDEEIVPTDPLTVNSTDYVYVGMNYVGFAPEVGTPVTVSYDINTTEGHIQNTIENVPVKPNFRTNIIGNLITSKTAYTIELDETWGDDGKSMEVIYEGLVKNINEDYEVSTSRGLAYAMNNLFVAGGNFYLTAAEYDLRGFNVTAPTIPTDVTLNIYGETPVVTRAATTFAGITIIGLPEVNGKPALIEAVENGGTVAVSGVTLQDQNSVIVSDNQGTLVVSESEVGADSYVAGGNNPVEADNVKDIDTLVAALASDVKVIELAADIEATNIISISRSVTINGNGNTLYTSANRAIRIEKGGINVVINNLKIVSSSASDNIYYLYGVSFNSGLSNSALTLNDCDIQFTYNTTLDNTYAVNVAGNGTGHKVTVNGGSYEGANVINVHGAKNVITVKNAVLNCLYPNNDVYYGACIWVLQNQGSSVYAEGNTFNGNNAIAFNLGTGTALEEKDNVDNTKMVVAKVSQAYYTSLSEAFAAAESGATVKVLHNTEMTPVTVASGKTITLDLNGKTVSNITSGTTNPQDAILVKGNLTVKNGTITTEHKGENLGWSAQSSIFNITGGGIVNLKDVVAKNLGGTDMGFVAHLNNWGEATFTAENCILEANYVAVRVFNSGYDKNNVTIKNSTLEGGNYAFWVHNYTVADFGTPEKAIAQHKLLNFNLTEGNTFVGKNDTPIRLGMTDAIYLAADQIGNLPTAVIAADDSAVKAALANPEVRTIYLDAKKYTIDLYSNIPVKESLTIIGTEGTQVEFSKNNVRLELCKNFTIENCEVLKMKDKSWGMLVFTTGISSTGVYTVSNCTFNGVGTQGIYINETLSGAVYNIENCTFNGDFGAEGAITIQDNANVLFTVNVNGCAFNNIPSTSHEVCLIYGNGDFTLNSDVELEVYTK